jgi:hypothetical protein
VVIRSDLRLIVRSMIIFMIAWKCIPGKITESRRKLFYQICLCIYVFFLGDFTFEKTLKRIGITSQRFVCAYRPCCF